MAGRTSIPARNSALIAMIADEVKSLQKNSSFFFLFFFSCLIGKFEFWWFDESIDDVDFVVWILWLSFCICEI